MARVVLTFQRSKDLRNPEAVEWLRKWEVNLNLELQRMSMELLKFGSARLSVNIEGDKPLQVIEISEPADFKVIK